jgi:hypothetical protein
MHGDEKRFEMLSMTPNKTILPFHHLMWGANGAKKQQKLFE